MNFDPTFNILTAKAPNASWLSQSLAAANESGLKVHVINGSAGPLEIPEGTQLLLIDDYDSMLKRYKQEPDAVSNIIDNVNKTLKRWSPNEEHPHLQAVWVSCTQISDYGVSVLDESIVDSFNIVQAMPSPEMGVSEPDAPQLGL